MGPAAWFGLLGFGLLMVLGRIAPQPFGTVVLAALYVVLFARGAFAVWRRTAMRLLALSWVLIGIWFAAIGLIAVVQHSGYNEAMDSAPWLFGLSVPLIVLLGFSERWVHPAEWQALKERQAGCNFRDMLAARQIPDLRAR